MRQWPWVGGAVLAALCGAAAPPVKGGEQAPTRPKPLAGALRPIVRGLPLKEVVLLNSGMGYFQHAGMVKEPTAVRMAFRAEQVNDVLKSLTVMDPAGEVRPATYALREDSLFADAQLREFLWKNASQEGLRQFQGWRVRLTTVDGVVEGELEGFRASKPGGSGGALSRPGAVWLMLSGNQEPVPLERVRRIQFMNEEKDQAFWSYLVRVGAAPAGPQRTMELRFGGGLAREVRAGYLLEVPVWKISYRLVMEGKRPLLQAWAHVENTSSLDWSNVRLTLVGGKPLTFIEELYQPLYRTRPEVAPPVAGSPRPQTYCGEADPSAQESADSGPARAESGGGSPATRSGPAMPEAKEPALDVEPSVTLRLLNTRLREALSQLFSDSGRRFSLDANVADTLITLNVRNEPLPVVLRKILRQAALESPGLTYGREGNLYVIKPRSGEKLPGEPGSEHRDLADAIVSGLEFDLGKPSLFKVAQPVTIPRGHAAMVPVLSAPMEGEEFSLYDPWTSHQRLLKALRIKNTTGLMLPTGPVAVFAGGQYVGDAMLPNLGPGETEVLPFSVDLEMETSRTDGDPPEELLSGSIRDEALILEGTRGREATYRFINHSSQPRRVLVQHIAAEEMSLVEPKENVERVGRYYQLTATVPAGQTSEVKVLERQPHQQRLSLMDSPLDLAPHIANPRLGEPVRRALQEWQERRARNEELRDQYMLILSGLSDVREEQERIRKNLALLERSSELYRQSVEKLAQQEARLDELSALRDTLREQWDRSSQELRERVKKLRVE